MRRPFPSAARALLALTAAGLVLSGCYYHRPYAGGPHYGKPGHGFQQRYDDEGWRHGQGHRHRHGHRGYH